MSLASAESETPSMRATGASSRPSCMIAEDQALIGLALEAYLEDLGLAVGEPLSSSAAALQWLEMNTPTVAVLDYALKDGPCPVLIRTLAERGIPFVIYSGHDSSVAPPELQHVPWIIKPCDREVLLAAITRAAPAISAWLEVRVNDLRGDDLCCGENGGKNGAAHARTRSSSENS
jgi:DNA-binding NtrC family response regulator